MPSKSNVRSSSGVGAKRPRSADRERRSLPAKSRPAPASPPAHMTQLSGATRNMRFMQRSNSNNSSSNNNDLRTRHSLPSRMGTATSTLAVDSIQVDSTKLNDVKSLSTQENGSMTHPINVEERPVVATRLETATSLDMYGRNQCLVLGRRSFGGCNPITAANWYAQQQFLDHEEKQKHQGRNLKMASPDDRRRYLELAREARNDDSASSRQGKKHSGKQGISNSKKRGLDEVLQMD
jgi:M-phase phosphoprotein 6